MSYEVGQRVWVVGHWLDQPVILCTTIRSILKGQNGLCQYEFDSRYELKGMSMFDNWSEANAKITGCEEKAMSTESGMTSTPVERLVMPVLCYVERCWAFFTTKPLSEQWGDDWNDAPYEHNAGRPYGPCWHNEPTCRNDPKVKRGWKPGTKTPLDVGELCRCQSCVEDWNDDGSPKFEVTMIAWYGPFETPSSGCVNSNWSVEQINSGAIAWLRSSGISPPVVIHAGTTIEDFIQKVKAAGGNVFLPAQQRL